MNKYKLFNILVLVVLLFQTILPPAVIFADDSQIVEDKGLIVKIDGEQVSFTAPPIKKFETYYVPLLEFLKLLGIEEDGKHLSFNAKTQTYTIVKDSYTVLLKLDNSRIVANGNEVLFGIPIKYNNVWYTRIRLAEHIGYSLLESVNIGADKSRKITFEINKKQNTGGDTGNTGTVKPATESLNYTVADWQAAAAALKSDYDQNVSNSEWNTICLSDGAIYHILNFGIAVPVGQIDQGAAIYGIMMKTEGSKHYVTAPLRDGRALVVYKGSSYYVDYYNRILRTLPGGGLDGKFFAGNYVKHFAISNGNLYYLDFGSYGSTNAVLYKYDLNSRKQSELWEGTTFCPKIYVHGNWVYFENDGAGGRRIERVRITGGNPFSLGNTNSSEIKSFYWDNQSLYYLYLKSKTYGFDYMLDCVGVDGKGKKTLGVVASIVNSDHNLDPTSFVINNGKIYYIKYSYIIKNNKKTDQMQSTLYSRNLASLQTETKLFTATSELWKASLAFSGNDIYVHNALNVYKYNTVTKKLGKVYYHSTDLQGAKSRIQ